MSSVSFYRKNGMIRIFVFMIRICQDGNLSPSKFAATSEKPVRNMKKINCFRFVNYFQV